MTVQDVGVEPDDNDDDSAEEIVADITKDPAAPKPADEGDDDETKDEPPAAAAAAAKKPDKVLADLSSERTRRKTAEAELRRLKSEGATEAEKATASAVEAVETRYQSVLKRSSAKAALAVAGAKEVARLVKLVDLDALEVDDEGEVSGVDAEVETLKETYPELFTAAEAPGRKVPRVEPGGGGQKKVKTSAEKLAELISGG